MLNTLNKKRGGFTLVEIMIVVAIIALLAAIAVPGFLRARKRSQATRILNDLRMIDSPRANNTRSKPTATRRGVGPCGWDQLPKNWTVLYNTGADLLGNSF